MVEGAILLVILLAAVAWIIIATAKIRLHAFLVLLLGAYFIGLAAGLPIPEIVKTIASGFGGTLQYIGIVIACGTIIGTVLEYSGGAMTMANTVLRLVGRKKSPLAMSLIGSVVSIPVFCDSGFVILSELNRSLAEKTKTSLSVMAVALSNGSVRNSLFCAPHTRTHCGCGSPGCRSRARNHVRDHRGHSLDSSRLLLGDQIRIQI